MADEEIELTEKDIVKLINRILTDDEDESSDLDTEQ